MAMDIIRQPSGVLRRVRSRPLYCLAMGPRNPHGDSRSAPGRLPTGRPHEVTNLSYAWGAVC
eukprot:12425038-Karenia_brevis.AAC.1